MIEPTLPPPSDPNFTGDGTADTGLLPWHNSVILKSVHLRSIPNRNHGRNFRLALSPKALMRPATILFPFCYFL
jgi:hypothetical protein